MYRRCLPLLLCVLTPCGPTARAAEADPGGQAVTTAADQQKRFDHFRKTMSGVKLRGQFTVLGKEGPLAKEEYTITRVEKMEQGDYWRITARIKYGKYDLTLPMPLEVKWAGDTPLITLTNVTIPGLGTFSSRVVIYNQKYAGTWTHGKVGGHLFGTIEKLPSTGDTPEEAPAPGR